MGSGTTGSVASSRSKESKTVGVGTDVGVGNGGLGVAVGMGVGGLMVTVGVGVGGLEQITAVLGLGLGLGLDTGANIGALGFMSPATAASGMERPILASNELAELPLFLAGELPLF